ncbi:hypothetical protein [Edaphocola flava]|uniref:hypothetical protein n=1 Tax=Edaphocola flava TaxID=2499629 RepID=UPI00100B34D6|nr:hypothetical protein [Edaphocola flava]
MKVVYHFLLCLLCCGPLLAQNNLFIAFNINDCASCSRNMSYIAHLNPKIKRNIILSQNLRKDSAYIAENFYLNQYGFNYIWSDSMYKLYAPEGYSSIALLQDDQEHRLMMPLKQFIQTGVTLLNMLSQPLLAINADSMDINPLRLQSEGLMLWIQDRIGMRIYAYHLLTQTHFMLECTDSINSMAYDIFRGPKSYKKEMGELAKLGVPKKNAIEDFWYDGDSIFILCKHKYVDSTIKIYNDIVVNYFYSINKFTKNGRHISTSTLPVSLHTIDSNYYYLPRLYQYEGIIYSAIGHANRYQADRKYLCTIQQQGNSYQASSLLPFTLPPKHYRDGLNHSIALYDKNYCMLPLEGVIYDMQNLKVAYDLHLVPENNKSSTLFEQPEMYIADFKVSKQAIRVLYADNRDHQYHLALYNRQGLHLIKDTVCFPIDPVTVSPVICDYNYNMLVFTEAGKICIKKVL